MISLFNQLFRLKKILIIECNNYKLIVFSDDQTIIESNPFTDDLLIRHEIDEYCKSISI